MTRATDWLLLFGLLALVGCAPTVETICQDLAEACGDFSEAECTSDGQALEERAVREECEDELDEYLCCVDDAGCSYDSECDQEARTLESCVYAFPH